MLGDISATKMFENKMVPRAGVEPAAYRLGGGRSIHLSYRGKTGRAVVLAV